MSRVGVLAVLAGCTTAFGIHHVDKGIDAAADTAPCQSFSTLLDTCALPPPEMWAPQLAFVSGVTHTYNAATHLLDGLPTPYALVTTPAGSIDVLLAHQVMVGSGATFQLVGPPGGNSAAIVCDGAIEIDGKLTVAYGGAGARGPATCSSSGGSGLAGSAGGGGGGGGGFGAAGGAGASGSNGSNASVLGGTGGAAMTLPVGLSGGCRGGAGGSGDTTANGTGGLGGDPGGAIALIAKTGITIAIGGGVNAAGAGGHGGRASNAGGGGGGAGGMIWIEADTLDVFGTVAANGGGGGEGAGGGNGSDGMSAGLGPGPAAGGSGGALNGGDGGSGGGLASGAGDSATDLRTAGGGGGGGGVGFIVLIARTASMVTGLVSPPQTMP